VTWDLFRPRQDEVGNEELTLGIITVPNLREVPSKSLAASTSSPTGESVEAWSRVNAYQV